MKLDQELGLKTRLGNAAQEALLNLYYTSARIKKRAAQFFREYELTDVQFNLLMLLAHQSGDKGGLTQVELSRMMLVNRANITSLIDRMEKSDLVQRAPVPGDRRYNVIRLTPHGQERMQAAEQAYLRAVEAIMDPLDENQLTDLIQMLETLRENLPN